MNPNLTGEGKLMSYFLKKRAKGDRLQLSSLSVALLVALFAVAPLGCGGSSLADQARAAAGVNANDPSDPNAGMNNGAPNVSPADIPNGGNNGVDGVNAFTETVYPIVRQNCAGCHAGLGPGFPHVAHPDAGTAYRAVVDNQKVNFLNPNASRLVQRLETDFHYCFSNDCAADGAVMQAAVQMWAEQIGFDPNGGNNESGNGQAGSGVNGVISSFANSFANAAAVARMRNETALIALYEMREEDGDVAFDTSGVNPATDLTLSGNVAWMSGGGLEFSGGKAQATREASLKLHNLIASGSGTQEYSVEAWVVPANTDQEGPAPIVSYSDGRQRRNFTLGQSMYNYDFRNRNTDPTSGLNGTPSLETADADEDLQAALQHVVITYDQVNGRRIYVNGVWTDDEDNEIPPAPLSAWDRDYQLVFGNETSNNRTWAGQIRLVAIYNRSIPLAQIDQNYRTGAVDRFTLRFGLDDYLAPGDYIEFEVSEFDAYSYLFCFPTMVTANPTGFAVDNIRIAVNGTAPVQSQSFQNLSNTITTASTELSSMCGVVPKDLGMNLDMFTIWFDRLDMADNRSPEPPPDPIANNEVLPPLPGIAIRDFDQVNISMAELTGVDPNTNQIVDTYDEIRTALPANYDIRSFVSAHQMAIIKLAIDYCDVLVENNGLRIQFFGNGFQFNAPVSTAFVNQAARNIIINSLHDQMIGVNVGTQPTSSKTAALLNTLIDDLTQGCVVDADCDATVTRSAVKGACASVLASAAVHIQ